jgi:hypothetical protein
VPETAHFLPTIRVALLTPADGFVLSLLIILALVEPTLELHVAVGDLGLLIEVLGLGLIIPVLVVVVPWRVLPLTPFITFLILFIRLVLILNDAFNHREGVPPDLLPRVRVTLW